MEFWQWFKEICYYGLNGVHLIYVGRLEMRGHRPNASSLTDVSVSALMYLLDMYKHSLFLCCWMNDTHEPTFITSYYFSCSMLLLNARLKTVIIGEHGIVQRLKKKIPFSKVLSTFALFVETCLKDSFSFMITILLLLFSISPLMLMGK